MNTSNQAVEAAVQRIQKAHDDAIAMAQKGLFSPSLENMFTVALRAELASPPEVAQGVVSLTDAQFDELWTLFGQVTGHFNNNRDFAPTRAKIEQVIAATRSPVAVGVEAELGIKRWRKDIENGPVAVFYTDLINGEMVHRDDIWLAKTNQLATQPAGAGGSVGREQDSFHVANAETHPVQGALARAVLDLNSAWNNKDHESVIAGHLDLCRRFALMVASEPVGAMSNTKRKKLLNLMQKCGGRPTKKHSEDGPRLIVSADDLERFLATQPMAQDAAPAVVQPTPMQGGEKSSDLGSGASGGVHRVAGWGNCPACHRDRIPGEGCARSDCPDRPTGEGA